MLKSDYRRLTDAYAVFYLAAFYLLGLPWMVFLTLGARWNMISLLLLIGIYCHVQRWIFQRYFLRDSWAVFPFWGLVILNIAFFPIGTIFSIYILSHHFTDRSEH